MSFRAIYFIGYETRKLPDLLEPEFLPRKGTIDPAKIATQIAEKRAAFHQQAASSPYTSFLSKIVAVSVNENGEAVPMFSSDNGKGKAKKATMPPAVSFAEHISRWNAGVTESIQQPMTPPVLFVGFEPKNFLKLWGIECAMLQEPIRPGWWVANSSHYNIQSLVLPDCTGIDFQAACMYLGQPLRKDFEPGLDAAYDAELCYKLVSRLGMLGSLATTPVLQEAN